MVKIVQVIDNTSYSSLRISIFSILLCYLFYPYIIVSQTSGTGNTSNTTQDTSTSSKQGIVINPRSVTWAGTSSYFTVFVRVCVCLSASTVFRKWQIVIAQKLEILLFSAQRRTWALS